MRPLRSGTVFLLLPPLLFVGYFFLYPLVRMLWLAIGHASLSEMLQSSRFLGVVWFTLWQAIVSTLLTLLAATPLTWAISRFNFPGKPLVRALVTVPFVLPTVVVGAAFLSLIPRGLPAILAAHVFYNVAVVVRTVSGVWSRIDPRIEEAGAVLGGGPLRVFRTVTLPLIRPAVLSAAAIVFLFCFTSFGTVLILGGGRLRTLEVEMYQQAVSFLDLPTAGALSLIQLVSVLIVVIVSGRLQRTAATQVALVAEASLPRPQRGGMRTSVLLSVWLTVGALMLPLAALLAASLRGGGAGWRSIVAGGVSATPPLEAVLNSFAYAAIATLIAVPVGGAAAAWLSQRRSAGWFDALVMLPLGVSAVTIGLGFLIALDRPLDLRGTWVLVPIAHAVVALPFVVRTTLPLLRSIRHELREAAAVLGASPARIFREIDLPIVARALAVGAGFAALVSLGEFGATAFVVRPSSTTVPALIYRLLGRPGSTSFSSAMALAVILAVITTLLVLMIDRARSSRAEVF
ncbi:MAG TPA: iron ABC transporter permease [Acidimicrobiia bacterium]